MRSFVKMKSSRNAEITHSLTDIGNSCPSCDFFSATKMSFNASRDYKILTKICGFTASPLSSPMSSFLISQPKHML